MPVPLLQRFRPKRIVAPSGDQVGDESELPEHVDEEFGGLVSMCSPVRSALRTPIPDDGSPQPSPAHGFPTNAILLPSGESAGDQYIECDVVMRWTAPPPAETE